MRAEIAKVRYLPLPRWTAAVLAAAVLLTGAGLLITSPDSAGSYISVPNTAINLVASIAALVFGVWIATLDFSSGTLQRTLIAEPERGRVLRAKLVLTLVLTAVVGVAVAAAGGGLTNLAANHAGVAIDHGDLAAAMFGQVPETVASGVIGFGFGLLSRSLGGGIALGLVFLLVLDGFLSFISGVADYSYGQLSQDLSNHLTGVGETKNSFAVSVVGTIAWCVIVLLPGWVRFLRSDLK